MSTANTGAYPDIFDTRQLKIFTTYEQQDSPYYNRYMNVVPANTRHVDSIRFSGLGVVRLKYEGASIFYDAPVQGRRRRTVHQTYALGYRVTMEALNDALFDVLRRQPEDLGRSVREHKENLAIGILDDSFDGLTHTGLDGRPLIDTAHPMLKPPIPGTTLSNELSPGVPFSTEGLEAAITNLHLTVSEEGRQLGYTMRPSMVIHHPSLEHQVAIVLDSEKRPGTDFNDVQVVSTTRTGITGLTLPHLLDPDSWWLAVSVASMGERYPLRWNNRMDTWFDRDVDGQTKDRLYDAGYRASVEILGWRGFVGSQV